SHLFLYPEGGLQGTELAQSDRTAAGTTLVKDINPEPTLFNYPYGLTNVNGTLFFVADDGTHGLEPWKTDGTTAGTELVRDINPGAPASYPRSLTSIKGTLFFRANDGIHSWEPWQSDGTTAGTTLIADVNPGGETSDDTGDYRRADEFARSRSTLFFDADDGKHGSE